MTLRIKRMLLKSFQNNYFMLKMETVQINKGWCFCLFLYWNAMYIQEFRNYILKVIQDNNFLKIIIGIPIFVHNYVVGGCDILVLKAILALYFIDFLTWFVLALRDRTVSSFKFFRGALKLGVYMILLFIAKVFDNTFHLPDIFIGFMYAFIIGTDSISILENLSKLWFNVPIRLVKYLEVFIEKKEKDFEDMLGK